MLNNIINWGNSLFESTTSPFSFASVNRSMPPHQEIRSENKNFRG